ncbi:dNA-binding helix-turn-helix protein [Odoribacter sp. CAG:788]|jgi:transcriptional regulator with XRE-family HTH domain|nr:dNA-binding helix-turn-helix protein [Odoribacter sp. CAG:788]
MIDNKKEITERLIAVRMETGLLSKDFAAKAGIDPKNYSSIENGKRSIGDRVMNDICRAFNISTVWLKTGKGEKYVNTASPNDMQSDNISMPREVFDQITRLTETVLSQQRTIETLSKKIPDIAAIA